MTSDDFKSKTMKDQPDQKPNGKKAKGLRLLSSRWWCPTAVTLGILCLGLLVILIMLTMQLSQVSDLLKRQQANLTNQEIILEGQISAQQQAEQASQESERELKETIETLTQKLDENSKKQMELHHCAYIQRGTVFADNCILTAFSICQKKANLLRAQ
uniref:Oxidized low density lipoprotein receptor 1 n=1 Tax=Ursus americanus TaxID=9643 RepID=A0A452RUN7_URSAM